MEKNNKKSLISIKGVSLVLLLSVFLSAVIMTAPSVKSKNKAYYSGDATEYNGDIIIGSTNMGYLELFKLENNKIVRKSTIKSVDPIFGNTNDFYDLAFSKENGQLFVYAVDGRYFYKYNITNLKNPVQVSKLKDNSWDFFLGVNKVGSKVLTTGTKGIKLWNGNLQVVDSFDQKSKFQYNLTFDDKANYIFNTDKSKFTIFDTGIRKIISEISIFTREDHIRKSFYDAIDGKIYLADDEKVLQMNYGGKLITTYAHGSRFGYDVAGVYGSPYLYVSTGREVVKINKEGMNRIGSANTINLGSSDSWSMGLNVVRGRDGERVVVFNNSNILVLNNDLKKLDLFNSSEEDLRQTEPLSLGVDKNRAAANSQVLLHGTGFGFNEDLTINFGNLKSTVKTDKSGKFERIITVPSLLPGMADIKVTGNSSKLTYSTSFRIE
ncbi:MAG: hypothetical protein US81_C0034G0009 [Parcubacteria group bacterium GW2011_GWE2_38_18]|nr:MAG: hypothetical protein US81_C0034G0009 [Parcubacteria group bacterium GW2011_GWE2_38_18]